LLVIGVFVLVVLAGLGAAAIVLTSSSARLEPAPQALARINLPLGGGKIERVSVVTGPHSTPVPFTLSAQQLWPVHRLPAGRQVSIEAVVRRPGWVSWLTGKTERLRLTLITPTAKLEQHFLTLASGAPLRLTFAQPIAAISYGPQGRLTRHPLDPASDVVTLARTAVAGSICDDIHAAADLIGGGPGSLG
jgi:hypothetical protein